MATSCSSRKTHEDCDKSGETCMWRHPPLTSKLGNIFKGKDNKADTTQCVQTPEDYEFWSFYCSQKNPDTDAVCKQAFGMIDTGTDKKGTPVKNMSEAVNLKKTIRNHEVINAEQRLQEACVKGGFFKDNDQQHCTTATQNKLNDTFMVNAQKFNEFSKALTSITVRIRQQLLPDGFTSFMFVAAPVYVYAALYLKPTGSTYYVRMSTGIAPIILRHKETKEDERMAPEIEKLMEHEGILTFPGWVMSATESWVVFSYNGADLQKNIKQSVVDRLSKEIPPVYFKLGTMPYKKNTANEWYWALKPLSSKDIYVTNTTYQDGKIRKLFLGTSAFESVLLPDGPVVMNGNFWVHIPNYNETMRIDSNWRPQVVLTQMKILPK